MLVQIVSLLMVLITSVQTASADCSTAPFPARPLPGLIFSAETNRYKPRVHWLLVQTERFISRFAQTPA